MTSREFMYMNKKVFTFISILFRPFVKSALLQNVCNPLCTTRALFYPQIPGQIMGGIVQPTKLLDHFLNGI